MRISTFATALALLSATTVLSAGVGSAAPAQSPVNFTASATEDGRSVITVDSGSLVMENGAFAVKATDGTLVAATPLTFRVDEFEFPIAAEISGRTATLTPSFDPAAAVYRPVALPFEEQAPWKNQYDREQAAWSRLTSTISAGATLGTLVGGLVGGGLGCVLGGIAGTTVASATIIGLFGPFIPAAAVGCVAGVLAVGAIGTLVGQIAITAPIAVGAAIQYFSTINAPFTPPAK
ncbi:hypothetical protein ACTD5D_27620 [Nocardia takedensis]|uniref:hypothetical protein n=1 Tax=Nocardia takedensis TaxID=259390 RepID=UPI0002F42B8D|nr:hypothetical protein [Nocardia takedensis]